MEEGILGMEPDPEFYAVTAQVIPVLILTLVIEAREDSQIASTVSTGPYQRIESFSHSRSMAYTSVTPVPLPCCPESEWW
jgi:hypothetical protein